MFALAVALSVVVGVSLGLLGGGGSILTVPILVYVAGLAPKPAIATSLFVVGVTSVAALVPHVRAGRVRWRTGLLFGFAGMTGAYTGGRLAEFVPGTLLLIAFGSMMLATAIAMLRSRRDTPGTPEPHELSVARAVSYGAAVGLVTGLVGAGGGFVIVPALALLGGLPMPAAVGTSLLVIAMNSFAGLYGHLHSVHIHWGLALGVTAAAVGGSLLGGLLVGSISQDTLRKTFGWLILAMSGVVYGELLPVAAWNLVIGTPIGWALLLATTALTVASLRRARRRQPSRLPSARP
ncbi:MAG: sulfite exporter TauE/SafE family protein [Gemmatimonadota bacterium]